jgi:hypothetical protein
VVDERLMVALVEGLAVGVVTVHIAGAAITVAGAGAAGVVEERVVASVAVRKDERCYTRWWLLLLGHGGRGGKEKKMIMAEKLGEILVFLQVWPPISSC